MPKPMTDADDLRREQVFHERWAAFAAMTAIASTISGALWFFTIHPLREADRVVTKRIETVRDEFEKALAKHTLRPHPDAATAIATLDQAKDDMKAELKRIENDENSRHKSAMIELMDVQQRLSRLEGRMDVPALQHEKTLQP